VRASKLVTTQTPMAEDAIRFRAYELYAQGGMAPGGAVDDWLAAEAELRESRTAADLPSEIKGRK
jgi:hypothetical protein